MFEEELPATKGAVKEQILQWLFIEIIEPSFFINTTVQDQFLAINKYITRLFSRHLEVSHGAATRQMPKLQIPSL